MANTSKTIKQIADRYLKEKATSYKSSGEQRSCSRAFNVLNTLYGHELAVDFSPKKLKAVVKDLAELPNSKTGTKIKRGQVNRHIQRIKTLFRWASSEEIIPVSVYRALLTVQAVKAGECDNPEERKRKVVPKHIVEAIIAKLPYNLGVAIRIMICGAARPSEVLQLRIEDFEMFTDEDGMLFWENTIRHHKTEKKTGDTKTFIFSGKEIELLQSVIKDRKEGFIFRPCDNSKKKDGLNEFYKPAALRKAVARASVRANVNGFFPYLCRNIGITDTGLKEGKEKAQVLAHHRHLKTTDGYFDGEREVLRELAKKRNQNSCDDRVGNAAVSEQPVPVFIEALTAQIAELTALVKQLVAGLSGSALQNGAAV